MSLALADLLIDLADPQRMDEYKYDPESAMTRAGLTNGDKAAMRSRNPAWLRHQALRSPEDDGPLAIQPYIVGALALDVIEVIEVVEVVQVVEATTVEDEVLLFADREVLIHDD